jgi:hypothetical protein
MMDMGREVSPVGWRFQANYAESKARVKSALRAVGACYGATIETVGLPNALATIVPFMMRSTLMGPKSVPSC